jgi:chaperonin GroEL (HSP60 family)
VKQVINELEKLAKPIKNQDEITQVATISAGDEEIGKKNR